MARGQRSALIWALVVLSLGGWAMHGRFHPLSKGMVMLIPLVMTSADMVVVTLLFLRRETANIAYLLNGLFVIYGITTMTHFGMTMAAGAGLLRGAAIMLPDCLVLFSDFLVGKALFDGYWAQERANVKPMNFLAPGWWAPHFILIPSVYALGHILWKA